MSNYKSHHHFKSTQSRSRLDDPAVVKNSSISSAGGCARCQELEGQLVQKETMIESLRSYQKLLTAQIKTDSKEGDLLLQTRQLKRQIAEQQTIEARLRSAIDDLNQELRLKEEKLHEEGVMGQKLSQHNLDLKRSLMNLEQEKLRHDLTTKYSSPQANSGILQKQQEVIELIERDYQAMQQKYDELEVRFHELTETSTQDRRFIVSLTRLVKSCHPQQYFQGEPTYKQVWSWLKSIMEDYMDLKRQRG